MSLHGVEFLGERESQYATVSQRDSIWGTFFNISFAISALIFFAPFILAVAMLIIVTDGRPIFYSHERVGRGGRLFKCLKFRTMVRDADAQLERVLASDPVAREEWQDFRKLGDDPRISCVGAFLRKTALDELPQFFNVLKGEMSVVGPRPIVPDEMERYGSSIKNYLSVRPGVTGPWQVQTLKNLPYHDRVKMDSEYVKNRTVWLDAKIIVQTMGLVLSGKGSG